MQNQDDSSMMFSTYFSSYVYTLWFMTNIARGYRWSIEIDGLPINSMVIFQGELLNNQRVSHYYPTINHY